MQHKILKGRTGRIFDKIADAVIPRGGPFTAGAADYDLKSKAEELLKTYHPLTKILFPLMLEFVQYNALLHKGKVFDKLSREEASRVLTEMEHSRIYARRSVVEALRVLVSVCFYDFDEVSAQIGYVPGDACTVKRDPAGQPKTARASGVLTSRDYSGDVSEECDVCIIGSGAGGAVVAKELAEMGRSVVVLEEGGYFTPEDWDGRPFSGMRDMYRLGGSTLTAGAPVIPVTMGKCIGGTTTINSATCFRTPDRIFKKWRRELGLSNLTPEEMNPYFAKVEKEINVTDLPWDILGEGAKIVKQGADRLGLSCKPLKHNVRDCRGCGTCQFGCNDGAKQSMDVTYIPAAIKAGAKVYAECRANRLVIKNGRVLGVQGALKNPAAGKAAYKINIRAKKTVVACGSFLTPVFLKHNGVKNRHIGHHLQIHPAGRVVAVMDRKIEGWKGVSQGAYIDDFEDEGIMLEGIFVPPGLLLPGLPGIGEAHKNLAVRYPNMAAFGVMVHDSTEGRVFRDGSESGFAASYFIKRSDVEKFKKGIGYTARVFFAAGAKEVYTAVSKMPVLRSPEEVGALLKLKVRPEDIEMMAFHPLGTCRMAASGDMGVVDECGRVFGIENLYAADGSIVPSSLGVNPQVTIMALAARIATFIDGDLQDNHSKEHSSPRLQ